MQITFMDYGDSDFDLLVELTNKIEEYVKALDPLKRIKNSPGFVKLSAKETLENVTKYQGKIWFAYDEDNVIGFMTGVIWQQSKNNM